MPDCPASWTTRLMSLTRGPKTVIPVGAVVLGDEFITSKPQYQVSAPLIVIEPSMIVRSAGYWRTMMGAAVVPVNVLVNTPRYVPPRSQIVSPGCTALGWLSASAKSHGRHDLPSPL